MRVKVDRERCQGHARCAALAPELFALDQFGNAREVGDGTVPPALADKAYLAQANCPEFAIEVNDDEHAAAGRTTGPPISIISIRAGSRTRIRSGTRCARNVRSRTPGAIAASISRRASPTCARSPTTPSTSPRAASWCATRRRRAMPAPPITSDPPRHGAGEEAAAAGVHAGRDQAPRAAHARHLPRADRPLRRPARAAMPRPTTRRKSRCG